MAPTITEPYLGAQEHEATWLEKKIVNEQKIRSNHICNNRVLNFKFQGKIALGDDKKKRKASLVQTGSSNAAFTGVHLPVPNS